MSLSTVAEVLKAPLIGEDVVFAGVSTDTRSLQAQELFVALKGENYDGHNFLAAAKGAGAVGAIVSRSVTTTLPHIMTEDTRLALGDLAAFWRQQFTVPVIAVTGSNGKTTVKEMIAAAMNETAAGLVTQGNLNNEIGVPLTLLRLRQTDNYAVVEMGMNHRGEIYYLTMLTRPSIAVITNASEAHLEGLGSVEEIALAKGEVYAGLPADGVAVINADDTYAGLWRELAENRKCLTFGLQNRADVRGEYELTATGSLVHLNTTQGDIDMRLRLLGRHNVMNALAATTASLAAGAELVDIKKGLEKLRAVSGRLEVKTGISGARVLDDTYNANPASVAVGIEVLREAFGERVLVLGDMAELGEAAAGIHQRIGALAKRVGVNRLFALGELSQYAVKSFGKGGRHFASHQALIEELMDCMHTDMTILVKGSRIMHMERVVQGILPRDPAGGEN